MGSGSSQTWVVIGESAPLGELLRQSDETIEINPTENYQQITVRMWGNGVVTARVGNWRRDWFVTLVYCPSRAIYPLE